MKRRGVAILGSTGSVGRQTLEVISWHPDRFAVVALAAGRDSATFRQQVDTLRPRLAVVSIAQDNSWLPQGTKLGQGVVGLVEAASHPDVDLVVVATSGIISLRPTLAALEAGKQVAVANKEVLVSAGHLVTAAAQKSGVELLPIDSEHSAIWQCLRGEENSPSHSTVRRIILTASGGAFRDLPAEALGSVRPEDALRHPNWQMGPKITVDSATMMNKGLEVIEAAWLFGVPLRAIEILIHRESIVHSLVEFQDHSMKAQFGTADMRIPIQYALAYPDRLVGPTAPVDLVAIGKLSFEPVDTERFRCPLLAYEAATRGGSYPTVLNAANEEAVRLFLNDEVRFVDIPALVEATLEAHVSSRAPDLEEIVAIDAWARQKACDFARQMVPGRISYIP